MLGQGRFDVKHTWLDDKLFFSGLKRTRLFSLDESNAITGWQGVDTSLVCQWTHDNSKCTSHFCPFSLLPLQSTSVGCVRPRHDSDHNCIWMLQLACHPCLPDRSDSIRISLVCANRMNWLIQTPDRITRPNHMKKLSSLHDSGLSLESFIRRVAQSEN